MATIEEQIEKMYAANLATQTERLEQDRAKAEADLAAQQEKAQKATDANLTRTAVEAQKAAVNNAELHNAYGLSSGTRAQARLAQENQLQADLTALRVQQQVADAEAERQRGLLAQEFASAIREAQSENDLAKAQALYEQAQLEEDRLLARQQVATSAQSSQNKAALEYAMLLAEETGDYSQVVNWYANQGVPVTEAQLRALNGETSPVTSSDSASIFSKVFDLGKSIGGSVGAIANAVTGGNANGTSKNSYSGTPTNATISGNVHKFMSIVGDEQQFNSDPGIYKSYTDYVEAMLKSWMSTGRLTRDELDTLIAFYGLA